MFFPMMRNFGALLSKIGLARSYTLNKTAHGCTEIHINLMQNTDFPHSNLKKITISLVHILIMKTHKKQICLQNKPYFHTTQITLLKHF